DFELSSGFLSGSVEWYHKNGNDLFGFRELDETSGFSRYKGNLASIIGKGIDLSLTTRKIGSKFNWQSDFLFSHSKDEVTELNFGNITSATIVQQQALIAGHTLGIVPVVGNAVYGIYSLRSAGL